MLIWDEKPIGPSCLCLRNALLLGAVLWAVIVGLCYAGGVLL